MPGRGTPRHAIRIPDRLWELFGESTGRAGTDRNAALRALIAWYVGQGDLPARPERDGGPPR